MARKRSNVAQARTAMYRSARLLGDYQAAKQGKIGARVRRRVIGRLLSRLIR